MRFTIERENFSKALSIVSRIVSLKPNLPILSNVLIETADNTLKLSTTNLEIGETVLVKTETIQKGKLTTPAKLLSEFISSLTSNKVTCRLENNNLLIESDNSTCSLPITDPVEFPVIPTIKRQPNITIESGVFKEALNQVIFAVAQDGSARPVLTGVLFDFDKNHLFMVSADGYRLSFRSIDNVDLDGNQFKTIVPAKTLIELIRVIDDLGVKQVEIYFSKNENQIFFKLDNVEIVSRVIDDQFPEWSKIVPQEFKTTVVVDKNELAQLVKTAAIFARSSGNVVKFKIGNSEITISATSKDDGGSTTSRVKAEITGSDEEIAFNYRYITDVLSVINSQKLKIELIENVKPAKFSPVSDEKNGNFYHIVMPVRLQD